MALNNFIPQVWAALLLQVLRKDLVYGQPNVINTDYEGDISRMGDTVKINSIGDVTIGDYTKNTNISDPETLSDSQLTLLINQSKFFNFQIDDIDKAQQNPKVMSAAMSRAGYGLADVADQYIASLYSGIAAGNSIGTDASPIVPTSTTAYEQLVDLGTKLSEASVPKSGRWVVIPPWYHGLLQKDDRFVKAGTMNSDDVLRNGMVGRAAGFDVLESNNVPNTAGALYKIIAGYNGAWSYADQISSVEGYRPEKRFADAMKGLHLYGAKVTRDTGLALLTASKS